MKRTGNRAAFSFRSWPTLLGVKAVRSIRPCTGSDAGSRGAKVVGGKCGALDAVVPLVIPTAYLLRGSKSKKNGKAFLSVSAHALKKTLGIPIALLPSLYDSHQWFFDFMPVDARSLLRASASTSAGAIADRFASYHPKTRALRCSACDFQVIKHDSLWSSHVASKTHRKNTQAIQEKEEEDTLAKQKEIAEQTSVSPVAHAESPSQKDEVVSGKRKSPSPGEEQEVGKRAKQDTGTSENHGTYLDSEWARFQQEIASTSNAHQYYSSDATIEAKPELRQPAEETEEEEDELPQAKEETPEEKQARLDLEERQDIFSRMEEEQRIQEEADERVRALRNRFEAMRKARADRKR